MRVVVAPDKFRGTATAHEVGEAMAAGVRDAGHRPTVIPLSDGGEGFLEAFGGANRTNVVSGPLGDPVEAGWRLEGRRAVIEMSTASGLTLVGGSEGNDAVAASTYGTGELIVAALESGAREVVIGVGGSATTDGGFGALRALYPARLSGVRLRVACDVRIDFVSAAEVFGPQKGASPAQVELLRRRLTSLIDTYRDNYGIDVSELEGGGAAGGLAGGLAAMGATLESGFEVVADHVELFAAVEAADLVVTGEGFVDAESFDGKVVGGVAEMCGEAGVPLLIVAGAVYDDLDRRDDVVSLSARFGQEKSFGDTAKSARRAVAEWVSSHRITP